MRYADLGGIEHVLQDIRQVVEWPLVHPEVCWLSSVSSHSNPCLSERTLVYSYNYLT